MLLGGVSVAPLPVVGKRGHSDAGQLFQNLTCSKGYGTGNIFSVKEEYVFAKVLAFAKGP